MLRTISLALAALAIPAAAYAQLAAAGIKGVYGGSYTCTDGEHGFYLDLKTVTASKAGFDVAGVLGVYPTLAGAGGAAADVAGSFNVAGTVGADGAIALKAGTWLKQPARYGAANLEGKLTKRPDGLHAIAGKPVVPGNPTACTNLVATQFLG